MKLYKQKLKQNHYSDYKIKLEGAEVLECKIKEFKTDVKFIILQQIIQIMFLY